MFLERPFVELLEAECTDEALGVEFLKHGGDAAARDGLPAAGAQRAFLLVVVGLAVREALVVEETAGAKGAATLLETKKIFSKNYCNEGIFIYHFLQVVRFDQR